MPAAAIAPAAIAAGGAIGSSLLQSGKGKSPPRSPASMPVAQPNMMASTASQPSLNLQKPLPPMGAPNALDPKSYAISKLKEQYGG